MYAHAVRSELPADSPYMQFFARALFLLARQCGAVGLAADSQELFELARQAAGRDRTAGRHFAIYRRTARFLGWQTAGRLAGWFDALRDRLTASGEELATDHLVGLARNQSCL
jgi:hypothetical protein